jgi:hypothetical protein
VDDVAIVGAEGCGVVSQGVVRTVTPPPRPCGLSCHRPGQRVTWVEGFKRRFGKVLSHETRTLIIRPDDSDGFVRTSCAHVVGADR